MTHLRYSRLLLLSVLCVAIQWDSIEAAKFKGQIRTLNATLNPGCPPSICNGADEDGNGTQTVVHIKAAADHDTLHYVWDFRKQPSVLVALTEPNTTMHIKWEQFVNDAPSALEFSAKPKYTMSFVLTKIFLYNDTKDSGSIIGYNASDISTFLAQNLTWIREDFNATATEVGLTMIGENVTLFGDGRIQMRLKCFGNVDYDVDFPHLMHSTNVTQIDFEFVDLISSNHSFPHTRLAAEFVLVADEGKKQPFQVSERKTLDDEHTPGIFKLIDITSPESFLGSRGSFVEFQPITYTKMDRDIGSERELHVNGPAVLNQSLTALNATVAWSYYGKQLDDLLVQVFNVSFGQPQDGFYTSSNFTTWTLVMGYGTAPPEHLSMFVIIVACIGMGIPLLLLIAGGVYVFVKRARNR